MIGILLAAGRGTRMKSDTPKVLFEVNDEALCFASFRALYEVCDKVVVIVGYRGPDVKAAISERGAEVFGAGEMAAKTLFFTQDPPAGTGDAVRVAVEGLGKNLGNEDEVIVLNGDLPLMRAETLKDFVQRSQAAHLRAACLSVRMKNPTGLGRILRNDLGQLVCVREEKDASPEERRIQEINGGVYYFRGESLLKGVSLLGTQNAQKEFYLTDLLGSSSRLGPLVRSEALLARSAIDLRGVNNTWELAQCRRVAQRRLQRRLCEEYGVDFKNPDSTLISARTRFEGACEVGPGSIIKGRSKVGVGAQIMGQCYLENAYIGARAQILWGSVLRDATVGAESQVGPMAHLRPGTELKEQVKVGNFVELKKTTMDKGAKASHLSYLGDAHIGAEANIGCGTITCNYDGFNKYQTRIGAGAFIGSDTQLVAPVNVGNNAYVGSGTTVTGDVPEGALALSRTEMTVKVGYADKIAQRAKQRKAASSKE